MNTQSGFQISQSRMKFALPGLLPVVRAVSYALTLEVFILISIGGLVRNSGAGLACPDWPLCYGKVVPPMNYQVFLEWFHRLMAGTVSVGLLILSAYIFLSSEVRPRLGKYCFMAILFLVAQIVLGGLTVLGLLSPKWVASHLAVGMAFFGTLVWLTLKLRDFDNHTRPSFEQLSFPRLAVFAGLVTALVYGQIVLGALVSSNYAGLVCPDFPTCNGALIPALDGIVKFQFFHRVGAFVSTLAVVILCVVGLGQTLSLQARSVMRLVPLLLFLQLGLGIGSVLFKLPLLMSVAHLGTAAALFGMLLVTTYEVRRSE